MKCTSDSRTELLEDYNLDPIMLGDDIHYSRLYGYHVAATSNAL
jgi:hypothetical protein